MIALILGFPSFALPVVFVCAVGLGLTSSMLLRANLSEQDPYFGLTAARATPEGLEMTYGKRTSRATWDQLQLAAASIDSGRVRIPVDGRSDWSVCMYVPPGTFEALRSSRHFPVDRLPQGLRGGLAIPVRAGPPAAIA